MSTLTGTAGKSEFKPALWTAGDWNAFFGFGTNILVNMLVLTGLLRFVLKMPDSLVFGRILPALGLMMCLSTFYYAFLAYRLAQKTGRSDVCALPSGVSVLHMFIVTFVIMLPITLKTGDPAATKRPNWMLSTCVAVPSIGAQTSSLSTTRRGR